MASVNTHRLFTTHSKVVMLPGLVIIYMFLTIHSLSLFCLRKFVIYISCALLILPLHLHYIFVCVDMFVCDITVSEFISVCL